MTTTKKGRTTFASLSDAGKRLYNRVYNWMEARCVSSIRPSRMFQDQMKPEVRGQVLVYHPFAGGNQVHVDHENKTVSVKYDDGKDYPVQPAALDLFCLSPNQVSQDAIDKVLFPAGWVRREGRSVEREKELLGELSEKQRIQIGHMAVGKVMGKNPKIMAQMTSKYFYMKVLDPRITSILFKVMGIKWILQDYQHVWQQLELVEEAMRIAPGVILPWLKLSRENAFTWTSLGVSRVSKGPIGDMLYWFEEQNLQKAQWKWLIKAPVRTFLCAPRITPQVIRILADPSVHLPYSTICKIFTHGAFPTAIEPFVIPMYKALSADAPKRRVKSWADRRLSEMGLIMDAFQETGWDPYPRAEYDHRRMRNASWATWMQAQRDWHDTRNLARNAEYAAQRAETRAKTWDTKIEQIEHDGMVAVALVTGAALELEGEEMHHCVNGYIEKCAQNLCRIFSIRDKKGERLSTLEITPPNDDLVPSMDPRAAQWTVAQNRGVCNKEVSSKIEAFGKFVAREYSK